MSGNMVHPAGGVLKPPGAVQQTADGLRRPTAAEISFFFSETKNISEMSSVIKSSSLFFIFA